MNVEENVATDGVLQNGDAVAVFCERVMTEYISHGWHELCSRLHE